MSRLDIALTERGLAPSRSKAKELVCGGFVSVNGQTCVKPSVEITQSDELEVIGETLKYVSRAGFKLEHAFHCFDLSFDDLVCADIGASTGGFTDFMLSNGAKRVYAVDVGHGQLSQKLVCDDRVVNLEGVNVKELNDGFFDISIDFMTADLSFISLKTALPYMLSSVKRGTRLVLLIKPQFEAGKKAVGKGGIVKNRKEHMRTLEEMCAFVSQSCEIKGLCYSAVKGGDGNIEYLMYAVYTEVATPHAYSRDSIKNIVDSAFERLK